MPGSAVYSKALKEFVFAFSELMLQRHNTRKQRHRAKITRLSCVMLVNV